MAQEHGGWGAEDPAEDQGCPVAPARVLRLFLSQPQAPELSNGEEGSCGAAPGDKAGDEGLLRRRFRRATVGATLGDQEGEVERRAGLGLRRRVTVQLPQKCL